LKKLLLILFVFPLLLSAESLTPTASFTLFKLESKENECGNPALSSTAYMTLNAKVTDIDSSGTIFCNASNSPYTNSNSRKKFRVTLAGIELAEHLPGTLPALRKMLVGESVRILTTSFDPFNPEEVIGIIEYEGKDVGYSLLKSGAAEFKEVEYDLDFWTECMYRKAFSKGE
jgi:hypothetical protein